MSDLAISLLFSAGCSGWIYAKLSRRMVDNYKAIFIGTGVCFAVIFLILFLSLKNFVHN